MIRNIVIQVEVPDGQYQIDPAHEIQELCNYIEADVLQDEVFKGIDSFKILSVTVEELPE